MERTSITLELNVWYDPSSQQIKLAGKGLTASTVSDDPHSTRYHPNLYRKLSACLERAGVPHPPRSRLGVNPDPRTRLHQ